ncbi:MAG: lipopolysaccharide biosynthesis protein [Thermoleophilaceae bacterium]
MERSAEAGPRVGHARRLASGSLAQQASQVSGLLAMLALITVLARRLQVAEFGIYGVLSSLAGYLLVVQNAGAGAAVRELAGATDAATRVRLYSNALVLYLLVGSVAGLVVALLGLLLSSGVELSADVARQARVGSLLLGAVTAVGWPLTLARDSLRARQLFVRLAGAEIVGILSYAGLVIALSFAGASLSLLVAASGTLPVAVGLSALAAGRPSGGGFTFARRELDRDSMRRLLGLAGYLSLTEAAAAAVYAADRAVLGLLRSAATVALFEGPIRIHNVLRSLNSAVIVTVLPAASRYRAEGDERRLRELLVRGLRYSLALLVPLAVTGMVLAGPVLDAWLGQRYREGGTALALLLSYWLAYGSSGVASALLVAAGRARSVARYAWVTAIASIALALALVPALGLEGVALATALPYLVVAPLLLRLVLEVVPVGASLIMRESFLPAYLLGAALAAALGLVRAVVPLDSLPAVLAAAAGGPLAYWVAYYALWLRPAERRLVRDVALGALRPRSIA